MFGIDIFIISFIDYELEHRLRGYKNRGTNKIANRTPIIRVHKS